MEVPDGTSARPVAVRNASAAKLAKDRFLITLSETGNPSAACRASSLTRRQINVMRERDPAFARAYDDALDDAADLLEAEAWRRALEGVPQPLLKAGQPVVDPVTGTPIIVQRYSDPLLVMLLRGCKPTKFHRRNGPTALPTDPTASIREIAADNDPPRSEPGE